MFPSQLWRVLGPGTGARLIEILTILEQRPSDLPDAVRAERVVELIMLMTVAASERARVLEKAPDQALDHATFAANLTDVLVGVLEAPLRGPLPTVVVEAEAG